MSDVTVAAPSGGAPAPASEVPVQVDQVNAPNAVGSQAPDAPTERRGAKESIQKAFERANNPKARDTRSESRPAPKAAEAKPGHNQPPEDQKLDLRKRPTGEVSQTTPSAKARDRGEHGHFAPRQAQQQPAQQVAPNKDQQGHYVQYHPTHNRLPQNVPYREPPNRFHNHAKHEWSAAPESVRAEVQRMYDEFGRAYKVYKGDFDTMQTLRPFERLAKSCNTTIAKALQSYVSLEDRIRKNPLAGLDTIVNNLALKTAEGQPIGLRDIAYYIATLTPEQYAGVQQSNAQLATNHQIAAAHQEIAQLKQSWQQAQTQQQFHYTRSAVDDYANSHPRLDELGDLIEQEVKHGYDLDTAYRRANLLRPANPAAQTRDPSAQTRPQYADRSISGSPGSSNGSRPKSKPSPSARAAVTNAISRIQGRA